MHNLKKYDPDQQSEPAVREIKQSYKLMIQQRWWI